MKYFRVLLSELIHVHYGKALKKAERNELGQWPVFGSSGPVGKHSAAIVSYPTLIIGRKGSVGKVVYAPEGGWIIDTAFFVEILDPSKLDLRYLYYSLRQARLAQFTITTSIPGLNRKDIYKTKIPLPPLEDQKRIAAILDKADAIRKKRKQAIELTNQSLRSAFLDMFGDPITNPKGWKLLKLGSLSVRFSDGPFGSNLKSSHYVDEGVRVIRLQNIGVGEFLDEDKAYVSREHFQSLMKHQCLSGDILIGTLGSPNLRACILPTHIDEALNKADCIQMRPDLNVVTSEYVVALLNQPGTLSLASHLLHGQTRTRISMGTLRSLEVPVPPLEIQQEFESIVRFIKSKIKVSQNNAQSEATNYFDSLVQRAFRGKL